MALHRLEGMEERLQQAISRSKEIFAAINKLPGFKIAALDGGTNIYSLQLPSGFGIQKFREYLASTYFIRMPGPDNKGMVRLYVNETLLYRDTDFIINALNDAAGR